MAAVSPEGERAVLALLAEQYAEIVELRIALGQARSRSAELEAQLAQLAQSPESSSKRQQGGAVAPPLDNS